MSQTTTVKCDGKDCKAVKDEANHWHRVYIGDNGKSLILGRIEGEGFWDSLDFCSERCLIGYVSRFIGQEQAK